MSALLIQVCAVRDLFCLFLRAVYHRQLFETSAFKSRRLKSRHSVVYVELCFEKGSRLLPAASDGDFWSIKEVTLSIQILHALIVDVSCPLGLTPVFEAAGFQQ